MKWKPKKDELFWKVCLCRCGTLFSERYDCTYKGMKKEIELGNCFRTRREALTALKLIKAVLKKGGK